MRLGLDCDGCLFDWEGTARFLLRHYHGITLPPSKNWDYIREQVPTSVWRWLWGPGVRKHGLFRHGSIYPGAAEVIKDLAKEHTLVLVTHRPKRAALDTHDFISYHRLPFDEVHVMPAKPKSTVPCDVYVDDSPKVIEDILANTSAHAVLMMRPWNEGYAPDVWGALERFSQITDWSDLPLVLDYLATQSEAVEGANA